VEIDEPVWPLAISVKKIAPSKMAIHNKDARHPRL
jgi:hypothetical protein